MANLATTLNTRVQLKFDTWENWKNAGTFIPLQGEVCIVHIPEKTETGAIQSIPPAFLIKVGDGITNFETLPWLSALAADVYNWAKKSAEEFTRWATNSPLEGESFTDSPKLTTKAELEEIESRLTLLENSVNTISQTLAEFVEISKEEIDALFI